MKNFSVLSHLRVTTKNNKMANVTTIRKQRLREIFGKRILSSAAEHCSAPMLPPPWRLRLGTFDVVLGSASVTVLKVDYWISCWTDRVQEHQRRLNDCLSVGERESGNVLSVMIVSVQIQETYSL